MSKDTTALDDALELLVRLTKVCTLFEPMTASARKYRYGFHDGDEWDYIAMLHPEKILEIARILEGDGA